MQFHLNKDGITGLISKRAVQYGGDVASLLRTLLGQ